jgi:hypothetical protein
MRGTVYVFFAIASPAVLKEGRGEAADVHKFRHWIRTREGQRATIPDEKGKRATAAQSDL